MNAHIKNSMSEQFQLSEISADVVSGNVRGFPVTLQIDDRNQAFVLRVNATAGDAQQADVNALLATLKEHSNRIKNAQYNGYQLSLQGLPMISDKKSADLYSELIRMSTDWFAERAYHPSCSNCDNQENLAVSEINGEAILLCNDCHQEIQRGMLQAAEEHAQRKGNPFLGFIGALIGALIGGVVWILIGKLGYIAALGGLVTIFLSLKGYQLLSGKLGLGGAIISLVVSLVVIVLAQYVSYTWVAYDIFKKNYDVTFFQVFKVMPTMLKEEPEVFSAFMRDLLIGLGLTLLVAIPSVMRAYKEDKGSFQIDRVDRNL